GAPRSVVAAPRSGVVSSRRARAITRPVRPGGRRAGRFSPCHLITLSSRPDPALASAQPLRRHSSTVHSHNGPWTQGFRAAGPAHSRGAARPAAPARGPEAGSADLRLPRLQLLQLPEPALDNPVQLSWYSGAARFDARRPAVT